MTKTIKSQTTAYCGIVALAIAALAGCSSDDSSSSPAASLDKSANEVISGVFVEFFSGQTPPSRKAAVLEKGDTFAPALEALQKSNPMANSTSATVSAVKLIDPDHATVTYTLMMGASPVLPNQHGQAVRNGDRWKVAAATFCEVSALQGGTPPGC